MEPYVIKCYGITKDPNENDYLLVFEHAKNGDLHHNISKNFKEITWSNKIYSLYLISTGQVLNLLIFFFFFE